MPTFNPPPPLRADLDMTSVEQKGQPLVVLSDALGLTPDSVAVSPVVVFVAARFDGQKTLAEIRAELAGHEVILAEDEIRAVAERLDQFELLETPAVTAKRRERLTAFRKSSVRPMSAAARGLPEDPLGLAAFMGRFYSDPKGPGAPAGGVIGTTPVGLVAPHIDLHRGGPHYAWAYGELAKSPPPDVVVAVGVAHLSPPSPWVMTRKAYETPFGPVEVDGALFDEIRAALWYDPTEEEWVHAKEHSLEFQALWLKYLWRAETPKWVPILCSNYARFCTDRAPSTVPTVDGVIQAVGKILSERAKKGQRVLVLAGIDLAHVGRRFDDDFDITPEIAAKVENTDRASLDKALKGDADDFFLDGVGENSWRRVCGLSALYTSLRWIDALGGRSGGKILAYGQAPDPAGGIVSFASAVFRKT